MHLRFIELNDFRSYERAEVSFSQQLTAVVGDNGRGKTNLLEAIGYLATTSSFRGAPTEAMIKDGSNQAIIRAEVDHGSRNILIEAEIARTGRGRVQVNRQRLTRTRDLLGVLRVTVFSPDDLSIVKGGPSERRRYLDDLLVACHVRNDSLRADLERVLRQRNTLLRQSGGRLSEEVETTLDVWDEKLVNYGEALAKARIDLIAKIEPVLAEAYRNVANERCDIHMRYEAPWMKRGLRDALISARQDELRRGVTLVGPHRDDLAISIGGLPARTHSSQGEQRSLALALRLAGHEVVRTTTESSPILLLDDVFSELDTKRSTALLESLPASQTILTTASGLPDGATPDLILKVDHGSVST